MGTTGDVEAFGRRGYVTRRSAGETGSNPTNSGHAVIETTTPLEGGDDLPRDGRSDPPAGPDGPSDADVVRSVLDGDREAYRLLVRRYEDVLFRHAARMVDRPDDAEDLVQRALVKGFRSLESCRHPEKVGGWLFRITSNLCKDYLKSRDRDGVALEDSGALEAQRGDPDRELARSELSAELQRALDALTADQREAFVLKHVEGRSYPEMSEMLEASVSALKMRVHRAREELQVMLEHYR